MLKAIKFRIEPNLKQEELLDKMFGCSRFIYNNTLLFSTEQYKDNKESTNVSDWNVILNTLKEENEWLKEEVSSVALQQEQQHLSTAFSRFFKKLGGYPKYKSKYDKQSISLLKNFKIKNGYLIIPKIDPIKINISKDVEDPKGLTISKTKTGKYCASFSYETELEAPDKPVIDKSTALGIDIGLKDYLVCSDGVRIANPKFFSKREKVLKRKYKELSRKVKGSNNRDKARHNLALASEKINNLYSDFIHKLTTNLVCNSHGISTLCVESLNMSGMMKNHCLAKAIQNGRFGEFFRQLEYKSEWYGMNLLPCDRFAPTSKICFECKEKNDNLLLKDREWICPSCGINLDRDLNASRNILEFAFKKFDTEGHRKSSELAQRKSVESKTSGTSQYLLSSKSMLVEAEIYCVTPSLGV